MWIRTNPLAFSELRYVLHVFTRSVQLAKTKQTKKKNEKGGQVRSRSGSDRDVCFDGIPTRDKHPDSCFEKEKKKRVIILKKRQRRQQKKKTARRHAAQACDYSDSWTFLIKYARGSYERKHVRHSRAL